MTSLLTALIDLYHASQRIPVFHRQRHALNLRAVLPDYRGEEGSQEVDKTALQGYATSAGYVLHVGSEGNEYAFRPGTGKMEAWPLVVVPLSHPPKKKEDHSNTVFATRLRTTA